MKNKSFIKSMRCALNGFIYALKNEDNLRFDISVLFTVVFFALFYGISRTDAAIISAVSVMTVGAELFNTAIERAVDTAVSEYNPLAKAAKDVSAAAVLVCAVGAVISGAVIFGNFGKIHAALLKIFQNPLYAAAFIILITIDAVLILKKRKSK